VFLVATEGCSASCLPGIVYDQRTAERSWRAMIDLFDETFGPPP
jgi:hypothetical protein